jgi:hypothetical protein
MIDYAGQNTTRAIRKRDFKAVALNVICWLLVAAALPVFIVWSI